VKVSLTLKFAGCDGARMILDAGPPVDSVLVGGDAGATPRGNHGAMSALP